MNTQQNVQLARSPSNSTQPAMPIAQKTAKKGLHKIAQQVQNDRNTMRRSLSRGFVSKFRTEYETSRTRLLPSLSFLSSLRSTFHTGTSNSAPSDVLSTSASTQIITPPETTSLVPFSVSSRSDSTNATVSPRTTTTSAPPAVPSTAASSAIAHNSARSGTATSFASHPALAVYVDFSDAFEDASMNSTKKKCRKQPRKKGASADDDSDSDYKEEEDVSVTTTVFGILNNVVRSSTTSETIVRIGEREAERPLLHCDAFTLDIHLHCCVCFGLAKEAMHTKCCPICICEACVTELFHALGNRVRVPCPLCRRENSLTDYHPDHRTSRVAQTRKKCGFCAYEGSTDSLNEHVKTMRCDGLKSFMWQLMSCDDLATVEMPNEEVWLVQGTSLDMCVRAAGASFLSRLSPFVHQTLDEDFFKRVCTIPFVTQFTRPCLQDSVSFIEFIVTNGGNASAIKFASNRIRCNEAFALKVVSKHWQCFQYFHVDALSLSVCELAMRLSRGKVLQFVPAAVRDSYRFQELMCTTLKTTSANHMFNVSDSFKTDTHVPAFLVEGSNLDMALHLMDDNGLWSVWRFMYFYIRRILSAVDKTNVDFKRFQQILIDEDRHLDFCALFLEKFPFNNQDISIILPSRRTASMQNKKQRSNGSSEQDDNGGGVIVVFSDSD